MKTTIKIPIKKAVEFADKEVEHDELLPCPFCGSVPIIKYSGSESLGLQIQCPKCRIAVAYGQDNFLNAVTCWNTRA